MERPKIALMRPHVSESAIEAVATTLRSGWIGQGPKIQQFEEQFREQLHVPSAVAVNSAAAGLRLALAVAGVGPGDEVITTSLTWQATNHPILEQGAVPVFCRYSARYWQSGANRCSPTYYQQDESDFGFSLGWLPG